MSETQTPSGENHSRPRYVQPVAKRLAPSKKQVIAGNPSSIGLVESGIAAAQVRVGCSKSRWLSSLVGTPSGNARCPELGLQAGGCFRTATRTSLGDQRGGHANYNHACFLLPLRP